MAEPFADYTDVEAIWRPITSEVEIVKVSRRIDEASRLVREQVPTVDARIADGSLDPGTVRDVVVGMVERLVSVGRFVRQQSTTVDDGSQSNTFVSSVAEGELFISSGQLARLRGRSAKSGRAFTIPLAGGGRRWTC